MAWHPAPGWHPAALPRPRVATLIQEKAPVILCSPPKLLGRPAPTRPGRRNVRRAAPTWPWSPQRRPRSTHLAMAAPKSNTQHPPGLGCCKVVVAAAHDVHAAWAGILRGVPARLGQLPPCPLLLQLFVPGRRTACTACGEGMTAVGARQEAGARRRGGSRARVPRRRAVAASTQPWVGCSSLCNRSQQIMHRPKHQPQGGTHLPVRRGTASSSHSLASARCFCRSDSAAARACTAAGRQRGLACALKKRGGGVRSPPPLRRRRPGHPSPLGAAAWQVHRN